MLHSKLALHLSSTPFQRWECPCWHGRDPSWYLHRTCHHDLFHALPGFSSGMVMGGGGSNGASPARLNNGLHSMGSAPLPMDFKAEPQGSGGLNGNRIPPLIGVRSLSDQAVLVSFLPSRMRL